MRKALNLNLLIMLAASLASVNSNARPLPANAEFNLSGQQLAVKSANKLSQAVPDTTPPTVNEGSRHTINLDSGIIISTALIFSEPVDHVLEADSIVVHKKGEQDPISIAITLGNADSINQVDDKHHNTTSLNFDNNREGDNANTYKVQYDGPRLGPGDYVISVTDKITDKAGNKIVPVELPFYTATN